MLCPEVWNFEAPKSNFRIERGKLSESNNCSNTINNFFYNHLVSVVIPDTFCTPDELINYLKVDCEYYKISNFCIGELINKNFIANFIRKGSFTGLSINTRIDCDDCVCITPEGLIILSLTKDTYQTLGLEGIASHFDRVAKNRYIVHVNLLKDSFVPGKKNYKRTKECLGKLKKFTLIICWEPSANDVCPSSVAKYFHDLNYDVKLCLPTSEVRTDYSMNVPDFNTENVHEFIEWLGAYSLQADLDDESTNNFLTSYETPKPVTAYGQIKFVQWRGFFTRKRIDGFFRELQNFAKINDKPWISLYVQGFSDSPVNVGIRENRFYTDSNNSYNIILSFDNFVLCRQTCLSKRFK